MSVPDASIRIYKPRFSITSIYQSSRQSAASQIESGRASYLHVLNMQNVRSTNVNGGLR